MLHINSPLFTRYLTAAFSKPRLHETKNFNSLGRQLCKFIATEKKKQKKKRFYIKAGHRLIALEHQHGAKYKGVIKTYGVLILLSIVSKLILICAVWSAREPYAL